MDDISEIHKPVFVQICKLTKLVVPCIHCDCVMHNAMAFVDIVQTHSIVLI